MPFSKWTILIAVLGVLGAIVFFFQFPSYAPQASLDMKLTRTEVIDQARNFLTEMEYDANNLYADANFNFRSSLALYLQDHLGLEEAHKILKADTLDLHRWHIYFFDKSLPTTQMPNRYNVWISPQGKVRQFQHLLPDSVAVPSLEEPEALALAREFLQNRGVDFERFTLEQSSLSQLPNRKDYYFKWTENDSVYGMKSELWAKVKGNRIGEFGTDLEEPEDFIKEGSNIGTIVSFVITASSVSTFFLLIFVITLYLKKYHEGEVGIKGALGIFAFLFALILIEHLLSFTTIGYGSSGLNLNRYNFRIVTFFLAVFIIQASMAAMAFAGWSVGESSARRGWGNKLTAIDGLLQKKPFSLDFAASAVYGYSFGFILLAVIFGVLTFASQYNNFGIFTLSLNGIPESVFPSMSAAFLGLRIAILSEIVFRFFFISWLREKTKKIWPGILVSSLLWTLVAFTLWDFPPGFIDFWWLFPSYFLMSIVLGLIIVRFDLLTAIFTNWVMLSFAYAAPMLVSSSEFFKQQTVIFYAIMAFPLVVALIGFIRRQKITFSRELIPTHIRRITERERMAQELEIARNVQMSLLPKQNPFIEGYDIAGICIPALEVGGDYYDFFQLGDGKMGIAIGDVSGKGVPAAIYMTLTKGILQSHAGENSSPKDVLNKVNKQMYNNIERNSFVSMFYAVLDMKNHKIRFSRAGHNPAILAQRAGSKNSFLQPKGIAVGLEGGDKFDQSLEEHEISLESGDVLAFYTDGFTEASTAEGDEYGEDQLLDIVSQNRDLSANALIQKIVRGVKTFVGNHPQHDDMTMVVIKVL